MSAKRVRQAVALVVVLLLVVVAARLPSGPVAGPTPSFVPLRMTFKTSGDTIRDLTTQEDPFYSTAGATLPDKGLHDAEGVRKVEVGGVITDNPLTQAEYAIHLLNSYRQDPDPRYLALARVQADYLIATATPARGALYFPYKFDFARHGDRADMMVAPWYSAMAQGVALALFVWLEELTGSPVYRTAAALTYNSFANPRAAGVPWTVFVDGDGYLWFEEYAAQVPDRTYNGHLYALLGLVEYYRATHSADALRLIQGGLATAQQAFGIIRSPGWISRYCVTHLVVNAYYHLVDAGLLYRVYRVTGDERFARDGNLLYEDYPDYRITGTATLSAGLHTGYTFGSDGEITGRRTVSLPAATTDHVSHRERIQNRSGIWLAIDQGPLAGTWVREEPGVAYLPGAVMRIRYDPVLTVTVTPGTYTAQRFDAAGTVIDSRTETFDRSTTLHAETWATVNGRSMLQLSDGGWADYWVPVGGGISD